MSEFKQTTGFPAQPGVITSYYQLDLLIMVGSTRITVAQVESSQGKVLSLFEYSYQPDPGKDRFITDLERFLGEESIFNKPYRSETIGLEFPFSTLIPSGLFDEKKREEYLTIGHNLPLNQVILHDEIKSSDITNVYCLSRELYDLLLSKFPSAKICHFLTPLLAGLNLQVRQNPHGESVFCQLRNDMLDIIIFRPGMLIFYNSFKINNKQEFVYYILFVFEQLSLNPSNQEITLFGNLEKDDELILFSRDFLGKLKIGLERTDGIAGHIAITPEGHRYFNLLSLRLCV